MLYRRFMPLFQAALFAVFANCSVIFENGPIILYLTVEA